MVSGTCSSRSARPRARSSSPSTPGRPAVSDPVLLEVSDGVARLTLNRAEVGNPVSLEAAGALRDHARSLHGRGDVRAGVLGANGPNFSVGGDLRYMHDAEDTEAAVLALVEAFHEGVDALLAVDAP